MPAEGPWYNDPTGTAATIMGVVASVVTLVTTFIAFIRGAGTLDAVLVALAPVVIAIVSILATIKARQNAYAPKTVTEMFRSYTQQD